ncbi:Histone-lysine N-methyltransferase set-6, partial [Dispira simplex]
QLRGRWPKLQRMSKPRKGAGATLSQPIVLGKGDLDHLRLIVQILARRQLDHKTEQCQSPLEIPLASSGNPTWNDFMVMQSCALAYANTQAQVQNQQASDHDWELYHQQQHWDYMYAVLATITDRVLLPSQSIYNDIIYREKANAFGYWDDESEELVGYGVFPQAAFFNHACDANLSKRVMPVGVEFTALRDISAGEELCIFYGNNPEESGPARRERLWRNYFFHCLCNRCRAEYYV